MALPQLRIPRVCDQVLVDHIRKIADDFPDYSEWRLRLHPIIGKHIECKGSDLQGSKELKEILAAQTELLKAVEFYLSGDSWTIRIARSYDAETDSVTIGDQFVGEHQTNNPSLVVNMWSSARRHLGALNAELGMLTGNGRPTSDLLKVHTRLVAHLEDRAQSLIVETARTHSQLEAQRHQKYTDLESSLRAQIQREREELIEAHQKKLDEIKAKEQELAEAWGKYEKEESHLVARKKREEQVSEIKAGLEKWSLTDNTKNQRIPVMIAYSIGVIGGGIFAWNASQQLLEISKNTGIAGQIEWWRWVTLSLKVAVPFAVATTCLVYFIRWSTAWARTHADEELRNRALLLDIGRSSWLLEAVRDAQERKGEIPGDLLRELSRNLFSHSRAAELDVEPSAVTDVLLQGLSSLRVKTADGSEVEARRGKGA